MKPANNFYSCLTTAALIVLASATIATAFEDTCAGVGATIGGTCTPLTNASSSDNDNTAFGLDVLVFNTTGFDNTAAGALALEQNTTGSENTATGEEALFANTTGGANTATGELALNLNTTGGGNTATGEAALDNSKTGSNNTATGTAALQTNVTGGDNTATGAFALSATTGGSNIGIGINAGAKLTSGDNNIDIGNEGVAAEANTIRIGTQGTQTATFIAGIFGGPSIKKGCDVVADSTGLLGCAKSSARYKRDIRDMGDASDKLMKLRPVTFRYKADSTGIQQYGLIAEEVERKCCNFESGDGGRCERNCAARSQAARSNSWSMN